MSKVIAVRMEAKGDLPALTGLRALAALWVVLFHFSDLTVSLVPGMKDLMPLFDKGWIGVNVFFMLSGFILTYNYQAYFSEFKWRKYRKFLGLRLARIYPVYLFSLLLMVLMFTAAFVLHVSLNKQGDYSLTGFLAYLFMVQGWGDSGWYPWNGPAWSVSAEWFAYLGFPVALLLLGKVRSLTQVYAAIFLVFAIGFGLTETQLLETLTTIDFENLINVSMCFLIGTLATVLYRAYEKTPGIWEVLTPLLLVVFVGAAVLFPAWTSYATVIIPFLLVGLACGKDIISQILGSKVMVYLGKISYSIYLLHMIIKFFVMGTLMKYVTVGSPTVRGLLLLTIFGLVIAAAAATFHFVEEPMRRRLRILITGGEDRQTKGRGKLSSVGRYYTDTADKNFE